MHLLMRPSGENELLIEYRLKPFRMALILSNVTNTMHL